MKLRLHANSIRLRLSRPEMSTLAKDRRVQDSLAFGSDSRFVYSLEIDRNATETHSLYDGGRIRVVIVENEANRWIETDQVGIESSPASGPRILIEKDFQCLHREDGDLDAYPNPWAASQT